jgi:hypothetical protein
LKALNSGGSAIPGRPHRPSLNSDCTLSPCVLLWQARPSCRHLNPAPFSLKIPFHPAFGASTCMRALWRRALAGAWPGASFQCKLAAVTPSKAVNRLLMALSGRLMPISTKLSPSKRIFPDVPHCLAIPSHNARQVTTWALEGCRSG